MGLYNDYILFEHAILRGALKETWKFFKKHLLLGIIIAIIGLIVGALIEPIDQLKQLENAFVISIITTIIVVILVFLAYLVSGPFRLWRSQKEQILMLQTTLTKQRIKQNEIDLFTKVYAAGKMLIAQKITLESFDRWKTEVTQWETNLLPFVEHHWSKIDSLSLNTITIFPIINFEEKINDDHNDRINFLNTRLEKFKILIDTKRKLLDDNPS